MNKYCDVIKEFIIEIDPSKEKLMKNYDQNMIEDLEMDSISLISLLVELERKYEISFESELMIVDNFETINKSSVFLEEVIGKTER